MTASQSPARQRQPRSRQVAPGEALWEIADVMSARGKGTPAEPPKEVSRTASAVYARELDEESREPVARADDTDPLEVATGAATKRFLPRIPARFHAP